MKYIRDTYNVPAKRGAIILFKGEKVHILSAKNGKLRVWRVRDRIADRFYIHPTWQVDYRDGKGIRL